MSNYYEKFKKGLTTSLTVAAATVSRAAEAAKDIAEDVLSLRCLKDYKLAGHVATAGPGNTWKIFTAINKKPGEAASYFELSSAVMSAVHTTVAAVAGWLMLICHYSSACTGRDYLIIHTAGILCRSWTLKS